MLLIDFGDGIVKEMTDAEYQDWFKEFVESYRCRICKEDLTLDSFGGIGENHMIFCKDCKYVI